MKRWALKKELEAIRRSRQHFREMLNNARSPFKRENASQQLRLLATRQQILIEEHGDPEDPDELEESEDHE